MIQLRLFAYLPDLCKSKQRRVEVPHREGMTVRDLLESEGLAGEDLVVMVNEKHVSADSALEDGDSVFFLPAIAGGRQ